MILLLVIFHHKYKDLDSHYGEGKTENVQKNKEFKYVQGCEVLTEGKVYSTWSTVLFPHDLILIYFSFYVGLVLITVFPGP